jgi:hypothetical protein
MGRFQWMPDLDHRMPRDLAWIKSGNFQGYGCSACDWKYKPAGVLSPGTLDEMKKIYETERDKEFAAHVCVKHPRPKEPRF